MKYLGLFFLFLGAVIDTGGDVLMKYWVKTNRWLIFVVGLLVYLVGLFFLALSYKTENIAIASIIFVFFNVATLSIISWFYFQESLTPWQIFGIFLGLVAVAILEFSGK